MLAWDTIPVPVFAQLRQTQLVDVVLPTRAEVEIPKALH
jgi:hypothetical protein